MTDPFGGILTAGSPGSWWAWAGARIAPAQSSQPAPPAMPAPPRPAPVSVTQGQYFAGTATNVVQSRDIHGDIVFNIGEQRSTPPDLLPWLGGVWQSCVDIGATVELRLLNQSDRTLSAYLLCRTTASDRSTAVTTAARLRDALSPAIPHTVANPITSQSRLSAVLQPFTPHHQAGIVEIRKRITVARSIRTDTKPPWLVAVTPLVGGTTSWQAIWDNLAAFAAPALLSVRLEPIRIGPGLRWHLAERAREFARLAVPGPPPNPTWPVPRPADPFASAAKNLYTSAVGRYAERAFGIRVSLASSAPVPDDVAHLLANTISPPQPGVGFTGDAPMIIRPRTQEHAMTAWQNITALNADPIGPLAPDGVSEESIDDVARALVTTADMHEAASVFRPPYPIEGSPTLFADDATSDG